MTTLRLGCFRPESVLGPFRLVNTRLGFILYLDRSLLPCCELYEVILVSPGIVHDGTLYSTVYVRFILGYVLCVH